MRFDTISGVSSTAARGGSSAMAYRGGFTQNSITVNFDRCLFLNVKRSGSAPYAMTHFNGSAHSANVRGVHLNMTTAPGTPLRASLWTTH